MICNPSFAPSTRSEASLRHPQITKITGVYAAPYDVVSPSSEVSSLPRTKQVLAARSKSSPLPESGDAQVHPGVSTGSRLVRGLDLRADLRDVSHRIFLSFLIGSAAP
ncbi:hypothetical protein [Streptomyces virginiae]|uniref:hypothetical protein n=1 Tax=Streptomyces virginiae TaxID=1961 RepID=UPI0034469517